MSPALDNTGEKVSEGGITIISPGYTGTIETVTQGGIRADIAVPVELPPDVTQALNKSGMELHSDAILTIDSHEAPPADGLRAAGEAEGITIQVLEPEEGQGQVLITTDGQGLVRWHFAKALGEGTGTRADLGMRSYQIYPPAPDQIAGADGKRGFGGTALRFALKVVVFPIAGKVIGKASGFLAEQWEEANRPYRLRSFLPEDYTQPGGKEITHDDIRSMGGKRVLLILHGTMSQSHTGMARVSEPTMQALAAKYEQRIIAFDHFTLSHTPKRNLEELLKWLPDDTNIEFDIICHSRGGLLARELAESTTDFGRRKIKVRNVVFAATPNSGTVLADADHIGELVDKFTNLVTLFPAPGAVDILETVIEVVKSVAVGTFDGLHGLTCMMPDGDYLKELNGRKKCDSNYFAIAANYEPIDGTNLTFQARDFLVDKLFNEPNDLIVPQEGVYNENGDGSFPIVKPFVFDKTKGIQHSTILSTPEFAQSVSQWLA